jgi:hypothetical protein
MKHAPNFNDLSGKLFNRLTVNKLERVEKWIPYWLCTCVCGNTLIVSSGNLTSNHTQSCGCLQRERIGNARRTHGLTRTRFYKIWADMKARCFNPNEDSYPNYGGRGITVCERWMDFNNFKEDTYPSYLEHVKIHGEKNTSLDRFPDVNGNYKSTNYRWTTWKVQQRSRRDSALSVDYDGHIFWKTYLARRLNDVIRTNQRFCKKLEVYLGCSLLYFRRHIESQFTEGMTWANHGIGVGKWNFDHIEGCNTFDLSLEADRLVCWNYKNIRPMWHGDHVKKSRFREALVGV